MLRASIYQMENLGSFLQGFFLYLFKQRNTDSVFAIVLYLLLKRLHPSFMLFSFYKNTNISYTVLWQQIPDTDIIWNNLKEDNEKNKSGYQ